ncbi:MAG: hypothetical protein FJ386_03530 [Verrucomicrobia bacterium]|nr:hypothetical protein [Verrucomicrobiota bacterium]
MQAALTPLRRLALLLALALCAGVAAPAGSGADATNSPAKSADKKGTPDKKGAPDKKGSPAKVEAAPVITNVPPKVVVIPKSSFTFKLGEGTDPFYPDSTRRNPRVVAPPPVTHILPPPVAFTNTPTVPEGTNGVAVQRTGVPPISATFTVRGVFVGKKSSVAINTGPATYDFFIGDELVVRTKEGISRVRCLEIKAGGAKISVEGEKEPRELKLRPDL